MNCIVLDSTALVADFAMNGSAFHILESFLGKTRAKLLIPAVVLAEVSNKWIEELKTSDRELERLRARIAKLTRIEEKTREKVNIDLENGRYKKHVEQRLKEMSAEVLAYPSVPHEDLVKRDLSRLKPFSTAGRGYRDALVWHSILEVLKSTSHQVTFITNNSKDFLDEKTGELHPDLCYDLEAHGLSKDRLDIVRTLEEFVKSHAEPTLSKLSDLQQSLEDGSVPWLNLKELLEERRDEIGEDANEELTDLLGVPEFENPEIVYVEDPNAVDVLDVLQVDSQTIFVRFASVLQFNVEFFLFKADYYVIADDKLDFEIWDRDWNDHYMWCATTIDAELVFTLTVGEKSKKVSSFEIEQVIGRRGPRGRMY